MSRRLSIFQMLDTLEGQEIFIENLRAHIKELPWAAIDYMTDALVEQDLIFVPGFSTIFETQPNGKFLNERS